MKKQVPEFENDYKELEFLKKADESKIKNHSFWDCLIVNVETKTITRSLISFVISTIKNKNHKLDLMMEQNILDVSFIRENNDGKINWYFEGHKLPRLADRLTKELEERYQLRITSAAGLRGSHMNLEYSYPIPRPQFPRKIKESEQPKKWYSEEEMERLKDCADFEAFPFSNPRKYKLIGVIKPILSGSTNEVHREFNLTTILESESKQKPLYKKLFNKFMSIFE